MNWWLIGGVAAGTWGFFALLSWALCRASALGDKLNMEAFDERFRRSFDNLEEDDEQR